VLFSGPVVMLFMVVNSKATVSRKKNASVALFEIDSKVDIGPLARSR